MLYVKGDYYLNEFITAHKHGIELPVPVDNNDTLMDDDN